MDLSSLLNEEGCIGLCTVLETTESKLFSWGCCATADPDSDSAIRFSVSVAKPESVESARLSAILLGSSVRPDPLGTTPVLVEVEHTNAISNLAEQELAELAHTLLNQFLRAYEHTHFDTLVPRYRLDGRPLVLIKPGEAPTPVPYEPVLLDLDDILSEYLPGHVDAEPVALAFMMGNPTWISPSWRILVDGARHFNKGNLPEAVLCACSSAEIIAVPAVEQWLERSTLGQARDAVRNAVREMGNPLRFELCISGSCSDAFCRMAPNARTALLDSLKRLNALRNQIVHKGIEPDATTTATALRAAATFVCRMWAEETGMASS